MCFIRICELIRSHPHLHPQHHPHPHQLPRKIRPHAHPARTPPAVAGGRPSRAIRLQQADDEPRRGGRSRAACPPLRPNRQARWRHRARDVSRYNAENNRVSRPFLLHSGLRRRHSKHPPRRRFARLRKLLGRRTGDGSGSDWPQDGGYPRHPRRL